MNPSLERPAPGELRKRILVVDDEPTLLRTAVRMLERNGFDAWPLQDPLRIRSRVEELRPDLVILDHEMPGLSGPQVSMLLRSLPGLPRIPVVFLSGHATGDSRLAGALSGAAAYLEKPINEFAMVRILRLLLGVRPAGGIGTARTLRRPIPAAQNPVLPA